MRPYHPRNLVHQPYGHGKVILLSYLAKLLGVQFHICGIPFGADRSSYLLRDELEAMGDGLNDAF